MTKALEGFEFPKTLLQAKRFGAVTINKLDYSRRLTFPSLQLYDTEYHPLIAAVQEGTIEDVTVVGEWDDDHCDCLDVEIVVSGKKYGVSFWWLSRDGVKMITKCEFNLEKGREALKKYILSYAN